MSSRLSVPYFSAPINILGHPKFTKLQLILKDDAKWIPFFLFIHAANHQADGDFSGYTPGLWVSVFQLHADPSDERSQHRAEGWARVLKEVGWFDEHWCLDGELFGNFNTKLTEEREAIAAQNAFNSAKRWHPEKTEAMATEFFNQFGRWPKGYVATGGLPPSPEASARPISSDPHGRAGEPEPPPPPIESERPAGVTAPTGQSEGASSDQGLRIASGQSRAGQGRGVKRGRAGGNGPTPAQEFSRELYAINEGLKSVPPGSKAAKDLNQRKREVIGQMTGVSLDLPKPAAPAPAPAKPKAAPADSAPMTALDVAKLFLETPDILSAGHVKELRRAGIALPPEVSARFPISPTLPALSPKSRTALSADKRAGATLSNPAAKARQGTFLRSKAFQPVAASAGQLKLPIRPTRKPAKQLATA